MSELNDFVRSTRPELFSDEELLARNPDARKLEPSPPGFRISFKGRMVEADSSEHRRECNDGSPHSHHTDSQTPRESTPE